MIKNQTQSLRSASFPIQGIAKSYDPENFEGVVYQFWEDNQCFRASDESHPGQNVFSMVIPPPNVTGVLHMGHALTNTIQDILVRWRRMSGDHVLWLPGTDHAGIATQAQVEKAIAKEGRDSSGKPLTRFDLGREKFVNRVWKWKEEHGSKIKNQLKRLGSSLDWTRERFTMDEGLSLAVREAFVSLFHEGLIYRGERIINWCVRCQTALSDLEVIPKERKGFFWHIRYSIVDTNSKPILNPNGDPVYLIIATTRPETLLGDTAVAIHPEDSRYLDFHGKQAVLPLLGRKILIITDTYVDRDFGTGALKVTPSHDFNDYELAKKHHLSSISVMGKDGKITSEGGVYSGLTFSDAREKIVHDLREFGLLAKTEEHMHKVGVCQRCEHIVEPIVSKQWFVKIQPLAQPAIDVVRNEKIEFVPKAWEKTYFEWMFNIRDWCISRQLWWGHQIPAWYCQQCNEVTVSKTTPDKCKNCGSPSSHLKQDEDVLDTWFSSSLWPFSTLGWPDKTKALQTFYPTSILETGFDIIFFWVARMIMMGLHFMHEIPFRKVYLHAMVRDERGEKMSKSKGNVIDPLDLVNQHGADPLRFTLAIMAGQGRDVKLSVDRVEGYRAFCNKVWNATKFYLMQLETDSGNSIHVPDEGIESWLAQHFSGLSHENQWIISQLQEVILQVQEGLEKFELNLAAQSLYDFVWREFCDWFIELSKFSLKEEGQKRTETLFTLSYLLDQILKLMHPFTPFVTERLWNILPWRESIYSNPPHGSHKRQDQILMLQKFPKPLETFKSEEAKNHITYLKNIVEAIRNFRGENNISPRVEFEVFYNPGNEQTDLFLRSKGPLIQALTRVKAFHRSAHKNENEALIPISNPPIELRVNLTGLVNVEEETKRLVKELEKLNVDLEYIDQKLSKVSFVEKAPPDLVAREKQRRIEMLTQQNKLQQSLTRLQQLQR